MAKRNDAPPPAPPEAEVHPEVTPPAEAASPEPPARRPFEAWREQKGTPDFYFAGAFYGVPLGREMTEAEYDARVSAFADLQMQ